MDLKTFPNHIQNAIIIHATDARLLPTQIPSYSDVHKPGSFYPFDNFQDAYIAAGTPVKIIHQSQDKAWDFVLIEDSTFGDWIPAEDIANVNPEFIKNWQHNMGYISVKSDDIYLVNQHARMGEIYPVNKISADTLHINIVSKDINGNAVIQEAHINKNNTYTLPLTTTPKNIATIANQFIGHPYGWGGMYGYRDCSSTTKNIFAYFGIWLPRDSALQKKLGGLDINLDHLSDTEKQKVILQKAVPFLSLIYLPGHIVIYVGEKDNTLYVFQDMWGLRTFRPFQSTGRMIVGKTVITPITFGKEYWTVKKNLLSRATDLIILRTNT
jgi:cell wall-associated NlpC family hydrolase